MSAPRAGSLRGPVVADPAVATRTSLFLMQSDINKRLTVLSEWMCFIGGLCTLTFFRDQHNRNDRLPRSEKEFTTCFCHIFFSFVTYPSNRCVITLGGRDSFVLAVLVVENRVGPDVAGRQWLEDVGGRGGPVLSAIGFPRAAQSCCGCVCRHFRHTGSFPRKSLVVRGDTRWGICALLWNSLLMSWFVCGSGESLTCLNLRHWPR